MNPKHVASAPPEAQRQRRALTLPVVAVLALAALLSLLGFQLALKLPGGQGIEDFLGWTHPDSVKAALEHWRANAWNTATPADGGRWHMEAAYLLVDTWLFMPLYAGLCRGKPGRDNGAWPHCISNWQTRAYAACSNGCTFRWKSCWCACAGMRPTR